MAYLLNIFGTYLPTKKITNRELAQRFPEWSDEKIFNKIGVKTRHHVDSEDSVSMARFAAENFFSKCSSLDKSNIDYVIFITSSPRYQLPTSACILQDEIGLSHEVGAIDINLGCSGYVYGLELAKALVNSGIKKNVLLITSEMYSKLIDPLDKGNLTIFGDAATCSLISEQHFDNSWQIGKTHVGTDGSKFDKLILRKGSKLEMDGKAIFDFTVDKVYRNLVSFMKEINLSNSPMFILHQANSFILRYIQKKLGVDDSNFIIDMQDFGNTVSNSIPLAMNSSADSKRDIVLAGFGVGLSWGYIHLESSRF